MTVAQLASVLRGGRQEVYDFVRLSAQPKEMLRAWVLPGAAVRAISILLRALVMRLLGVGIVLAISSMLLQVGTWWCMALILPLLAQAFALPLSATQGYLLATLLCAPMWLAGILFLFPEDPPAIFYITRTCVGVVTLWGVYLFLRSIETLPCPPAARRVLVLGAGSCYLLVYLGLFIVLGITANVVLFLTG